MTILRVNGFILILSLFCSPAQGDSFQELEKTASGAKNISVVKINGVNLRLNALEGSTTLDMNNGVKFKAIVPTAKVSTSYDLSQDSKLELGLDASISLGSINLAIGW